MINRKLILSIFLATATLLLVLSPVAQAVPSLGVATGSYVGDAACASASSYIDCFTGPYVSGSGEGFEVGPSGSDFLVFSNITGADIWLLTTSDTGSPQIDGSSMNLVTLISGDHWDGYDTVPYYGVNLGPVDSSWQTLPNPPFNPDAPFYLLSVTLTYTGSLPEGQYFFAVADIDGNGLEGQGSGSNGSSDPFSPKTTSARVPEPSSLVMLGAGLLGLAFYRMRSRRR